MNDLFELNNIIHSLNSNHLGVIKRLDEVSIMYPEIEENAILSILAVEKARNLIIEKGIKDSWETRKTTDLKGVLSTTYRFEDNVLYINIPVLLPHRKAPFPIYFEKELGNTLQQLRRETWFQAYRDIITKKAVLCMKCNYPKDISVRDNDNVEHKQVIDILVQYGILMSDAGTRLSLFTESSVIEGPGNTEITITDMANFKELLKMR